MRTLVPSRIGLAFLLVGLMGVAGCTQTNASRLGMVDRPGTGQSYGSVVEKSFLLEADQFENRKIRITIRNTSGDPEFNVTAFKSQIENAFASKGFEPVNTGHAIRLDLNVMYSGQIRRDLASEYAFLGAAAGGIVGYRSPARAGTAIGILSGATIGAIIGSTQVENTYIVISEVAVARTGASGKSSSRTVVFGSSPPLQDDSDSGGFRPYRSVLTNRLAVYGGGYNQSQAAISPEVKRRLVRIVSDIF